MATDSDVGKVLERLDRIEAALNRLVALAEKGAPAAPAPRVVPVAAAAAGAAAAAAAVVAKPAPKPAAAPTPAPLPAPTPAKDPIEATLQQMFAAALLPKKEQMWEALVALTDPAAMEAPRALDNLRAFSWKKLRSSCGRYLSTEGDPGSFKIDRRQPRELEPETTRIKVFVTASNGGSAPVTLVRVDDAHAPWRLKQISL